MVSTAMCPCLRWSFLPRGIDPFFHVHAPLCKGLAQASLRQRAILFPRMLSLASCESPGRARIAAAVL